MINTNRLLAIFTLCVIIYNGSISSSSFVNIDFTPEIIQQNPNNDSLFSNSSSSLHLFNTNTTAITSFFNKSAIISDMGQRVAKETLQRSFAETITERDVVDQIKFQMIDSGSDETLAFSPIVASGVNSVQPHGDLSDDDYNYIKLGEAVVVDIGAKYNGYSTDITRTYFVGQPTSYQKEIYDIVLEAQQAGIDAIKPGINVSVVAHAARDIIDKNGYGDDFPHLTGHSLGPYVHEYPSIGVDSPGILTPGMVITIEPGIYLSDVGFGIRIEDDVLVTETGYEVLTHTPKTLYDVIILENSSIGYPSIRITNPIEETLYHFYDFVDIRAEIIPYSEGYPVTHVGCKIDTIWYDMTLLEGEEYSYSFMYDTTMSGRLEVGVKALAGDLWITDIIKLNADLHDTTRQMFDLPEHYQSANPTPVNINETWLIHHNRATQLRIHFSSLKIEYFSHLYLRDINGHVYIEYEGVDQLNADIWSPWIPKDTIIIHLQIEFNNAYAFHIDKYEIPSPTQSISGNILFNVTLGILVLVLVYGFRKKSVR